VDNTTDIAWAVIRAQAGDREALEQVLVSGRSIAAGVVRRVALDEADDVLQHVLWVVARKLRYLDKPAAFRAWVYRIAAREAERHAARERRRWWTRSVDDLDSLEAAEPAPTPALVETIPDLLAAVTPRSRSVLVLHYLEEQPLDQVARILDLPLGTVKSRLAYGLRAMRRAYAEKTT
jgi:RNA polymerase sigma-70 factor, ECF subfamily